VGINTSSGEGWGLVSLEHAATGAPQVVPSHTACGEVWQGMETMLPTRREAEHVGLGMRRELVGEDDVAEVLERLYTDREFRRGQARQAYQIAQRASYRWPEIAGQWDTLFGTVLERRMASPASHHGAPSYAE
jgi:glycosyltransferase involved in cell wall biosynthesis